MFEQIFRGAMWFIVATYAIGTFKTLTLVSRPNEENSQSYVMVTDKGRKPLIYPAITGSDVPMPFSQAIQTSSRIVGLSKVYYALYGGMPVRDSRYRAFWR